MSKIVSEMFYGRSEPHWMMGSQGDQVHQHTERRGCVRQVRGYRSDSNPHTPAHEGDEMPLTRSRGLQHPHMATAASQLAAVHHSPSHRTTSTAASNIPVSSLSQSVELMVPMCCAKCEEKVKEEIESMEGVYAVVCDQHNQRVTVTSNVDPQRLLKRVKRVKKKSEFWSGSTQIKHIHFPSDSPISQTHHSLSPPHSHTPVLSHREHPHRNSRSPDPTHRETSYRASRSLESHRQIPRGLDSDQNRGYHRNQPSYTSPCAAPYRPSFNPEVYPAPFAPPPTSAPLYDHFTPAYAQTYETEEYPLYTYYY